MLSSSSGFYKDTDGAAHPATSVEVYLPWTDTWEGLGDMPVWHEGGSERKMDQAGMIFLPSEAELILLGGLSMDWNTGVDYLTKKVFELTWNSSSHSYYWHCGGAPDLGKWTGLLRTVTHVQLAYVSDIFYDVGLETVAVPDSFLSTFHQ